MSVGTVLVVGPPLAGAGAVAAALRVLLNDCHVTESAAVRADVVVFVVSAAAPMTHGDVALLDDTAVGTDAVVSVVTKIDVHRTWRETMEANRSALARHAPRYRATRWVGAAADPHIGPPVIDPLVDAVRAALVDDGRAERNRLRAAGVRSEQTALRQAQAAQRDAQRASLRAEVRHARLELAAAVRASVVTLRSELQHRVAAGSRRDIAGFDEQVRRRVSRVAADFDDLVRGRFAELCRSQALAVPVVPPAPSVWDGLPPPHRPAADPVTVVFAVTFGIGVALTLGRLAELAGGAFPWTLAGSGVVGITLAVWVARARRLMAARGAADRWVAEVSAGLRSALEDRVLAAESSLLAVIAEQARSPN